MSGGKSRKGASARARSKCTSKYATEPAIDDEVYTEDLDMCRAVLKQYCCPVLTAELEAQTDEQQRVTLEAVGLSVSQRLLHKVISAAKPTPRGAAMAASGVTRLPHHTVQDMTLESLARSCDGSVEAQPPLLKTFILHMLPAEFRDVMTITEEYVEEVQDRLSWFGKHSPGSPQAFAMHTKMMETRIKAVRDGIEMGALTTLHPSPKDAYGGPWRSLRVCRVTDLGLNALVSGGALVGTLLGVPIVMYEVIHLRLEDVTGHAIPVYLHNSMPRGRKVPAQDRAAAVQRKFAAHVRIAIAEPECIIDTDGCRVVYVRSTTAVKLGADADAFIRFRKPSASPRASLPDPSADVDYVGLTQALKDLMASAEPDVTGYFVKVQSVFQQDCSDLLYVLAGRAQAALKMGDGAAALRDAAAVLVLCPAHDMAWDIYISALRTLVDDPDQADRLEARADCVATAIQDPKAARSLGPTSATVQRDGELSRLPSAEAVDAVLMAAMTRGNRGTADWSQLAVPEGVEDAELGTYGAELYERGDYAGAIAAYTRVLEFADFTLLAGSSLAMLASAFIAASDLHSALALAAASVAISSGVPKRASTESWAVTMCTDILARLGRAQVALEMAQSANRMQRHGSKEATVYSVLITTLRGRLERQQQSMADGEVAAMAPAVARLVLEDFLGPVKFVATPESQALVATSDLPPQTVVMVSSPVAHARGGRKGTTAMTFQGREWEAELSQKRLAAKLQKVVAEEPLKARTLEHLGQICDFFADPDGTGSVVYTYRHGADVLLCELQQALSPRVLPLLPARRQYFPTDEHPPLLVPALARLSFTHGHRYVSPSDGSDNPAKDPGSTIYPLASLLGVEGEDDANCLWTYGVGWMPAVGAPLCLKQSVVVFTKRAVQAGEVLSTAGSGPPPQGPADPRTTASEPTCAND